MYKLPIEKSTHNELRLVHGRFGEYFKNIKISDNLEEKQLIQNLFDNLSMKDLKEGYEKMKIMRDKLQKKKRSESENKTLANLREMISLITDEAQRRKK